MKSHALMKLGKQKDLYSDDGQTIDSQYDNMSIDERNERKKVWKNLVENYEPRFMTYIGHSPVTFDYELLAPKRYDNPDQLNAISNGSTASNNIRFPIQPEMEVLSQLCESKSHQNLIKHPVVKSWVWLKWSRVCKYYHKNLRLDFLLMWFMTWYVVQTFGGFEWNNICATHDERHKNDRNLRNPDWNWSNYTSEQFCEFYDQNLTSQFISTPYGYLESLYFIDRIQYHWNYLFKNKHRSCMYMNRFYVVYCFIALVMIYTMVVDAVKMFKSPNPYKRRRARKSNIFFTRVVPVLGFVRDFLIIMGVVLFADGMLWVAITVLYVSMLLGEIQQFVAKPKSYFFSKKNWSDITQLILIGVIMYVPNQWVVDPLYFSRPSLISLICHPKGENGADLGKPLAIFDESDVSVKRCLSAFLIIVSWSTLLFQIANHPSKRTENFNKYVMMYQTVAKSFMKLFLVYGLFVISFSIGFYIMFHDDIGEDKKLGTNSLTSYVFFDTPYEAFAKTIAMFVGEVDFNNMPIGISYSRRHGNISVTLAYLFFLTFIFMVVIVLMNLLNGLAVSDIADIVAKAEIKHQISIINILKDLEDRAINNKITLDWFSKYLPCLKSFFEIFDFEQELKVFPETEKIETIDLPYKRKGSKLNWLYMTQRNKKLKVGCEHIISEARKILYENNKS